MVIEMDGISIEILRKPIKNMYLRIHSPAGDVKVSAPLKLPLADIKHHLVFKKNWIQSSRDRVIKRNLMTPVSMESDDKHYFLGNLYQLVIHPNTCFMRIELEAQVMHCFIKSNTDQAGIKRLLQTWYKQQMQKIIPGFIQKWETIIGVRTQSFTIKSMKTRWGSCNVMTKRICLNLHLIKKPHQCLEYVIVHELVHLLEASHNHRFYALMTQFMPQWKEYKEQLELGASLNSLAG